MIEAVLTLTLLAGGMLGVLTMYERNVSQANAMEQTLVATQLAQEKMEQIIQNKKYQLYASIIPGNYPSPENLTAQGFPSYTRTTSIVEVSATNLTTPQTGTGYKRITVSVSATGMDTVILTTLLTEWGEQ